MKEHPSDPDTIARAIRAQITEAAGVTHASLSELERALARFPDSASLWELRGDLIQLGEDESRFLQDAQQSYLKAAALAPSDPSPFESLGFFYDRVLDDPARAELFFRRAIALGAGPSALTGLDEVLKQLTALSLRLPSARTD